MPSKLWQIIYKFLICNSLPEPLAKRNNENIWVIRLAHGSHIALSYWEQKYFIIKLAAIKLRKICITSFYIVKHEVKFIVMFKLDFKIVLCIYLTVFTYHHLLSKAYIFLLVKAERICEKEREEKGRMICSFFCSEKAYLAFILHSQVFIWD